MSYNLLFNTSFQKDNCNWKFNNCEYKNGFLTSNKKVFGIEQELVLPDIIKVYLRFNYIVYNKNIKSVICGIQSGNILEANEIIPKIRKDDIISVVDVPKEEKITVHLIFESTQDINKVYINNPMLVNLEMIGKTTWVKFLLDKTLKFRNGYSYDNLYKESEVSQLNTDFYKQIDIEKGKIGTLIKTKSKQKKDIILSCDKLENNHYYLCKIDFKNINEHGNIKLSYGYTNSEQPNDEQIYLLFKKNDKDTQIILCFSNEKELDYICNLKHIMIIDITKLGLLKNDIEYLPFI